IAELADAGPTRLGRVELMQNGLAPNPVAIALLDPVLEIVNSPREPDILTLPDRHRLAVVLVGWRMPVVPLALDPRLPKIAPGLALLALAFDREPLAMQQLPIAVAGQEPVDELRRELGLLIPVDVVRREARQLRHLDARQRRRNSRVGP